MGVNRFELPGDGVLAARVCLAQRMPAGDPVELASVARRTAGRAVELRQVAAVLLSSAEGPLWAGAAHRAFLEQVRAHAPTMSATADRYEHYATALDGYAVVLGEAAPRLRAVRHRLREACEQLTGSCPTSAPVAGGTFVADPFATVSHGSRASADMAADLLAIARDFKAGYELWADALDRCIRALSQLDHVDPTRHSHGLAALGGRVAHAAGAVVAPFERAVLHPTLHNLSDCLSMLNTDLTVLGLGLLFICPPAGTACLAAATVLAVAQVAVDATRRAHGEHVGNAVLGLELAAAIPLGGGAVRGLRAADNVTHLVPGGGLMAHEGLDDGHTLVKHVGKTDEFLRNRLTTEPGIKAASTFYDRGSAEGALSELIDAHASEITRWLQGDGFELILQGRAARSIGVVIPRSATRPVEATGIRLVLRRSPATGVGFRIHTAMVTR
jgi:uncharacterized protein YukE